MVVDQVHLKIQDLIYHPNPHKYYNRIKNTWVKSKDNPGEAPLDQKALDHSFKNFYGLILLQFMYKTDVYVSIFAVWPSNHPQT